MVYRQPELTREHSLGENHVLDSMYEIWAWEQVILGDERGTVTVPIP